MYFHQALKEPNKIHFINVMVKEVMTHNHRKRWKPQTTIDVPDSAYWTEYGQSIKQD